MPPLIQILLPFKIQAFPSSEGTALVLIDAASDPLDGSVKAKAANISPVANLGKYFSFCSLFPKSKIPLNPIDYKQQQKSFIQTELHLFVWIIQLKIT